MPQIVDKFQEQYQKNLAMPEMNRQGFEQSQLSGAPIGAQGFAGLQSFQRGETPAYAIQSPAGQRQAREQFAAHGDPAVQARQRQASVAGVVRAHTPDAVTGKTPTQTLQAGYGSGQPPAPPTATAAPGATPPSGNPKREAALAKIQERRAQRQRQQGVNPAGMQYNAMVQASNYKEDHAHNLKTMEAQQKAQEDAAKQAEASKPKISDLKRILPPGDGELDTDKGFHNWHGRALKRWEAVQSGQPAYTAPDPFAPLNKEIADTAGALGIAMPKPAAPVDPNPDLDTYIADLIQQGRDDLEIEALVAEWEKGRGKR